MPEWFEKKPFGSMPDEAARRWGHKEAIYHECQRWSFTQFQREVNRTGKGLISLGVQPEDKVPLWVTNRPEWLFCFYSLAKIGAVTAPINTRFRTNDLEYVVKQSDSTTLITSDRSGPVDYLEMVGELCPEIKSGNPNDLRPQKFPELKRVLVLGENPHLGTCRWDDVMNEAGAVSDIELEQRQQQVDPDATALIMYTSGTPGFPKGVMYCHNIRRQVGDIARRLGITLRNVSLKYLPLFHVFALVGGTMLLLESVARMVLTTLFDPEETMRLIQQEKGTLIYGFDTHFSSLTGHPDLGKTGRGSLRTGI